MKFKLPPFQTRTALLAMSASMIFVGAASASYGPVIAHDFPAWVLNQPFFHFSFLLFGVGGVMLYLSKTFARRFHGSRIINILIASPLFFFGVLFSVSGSPMVVAWLISTAIIALISLLNEDPLDEIKTVPILGPYAYLMLVLWGTITVILGRFQSVYDIIFIGAALLLGLLGIILFIGNYKKAESLVRFASGLILLSVATQAFLFGHPLMHVLLIAPLGLALLLEGTLSHMRFGQPNLSTISEETARIRQFQDVTEFNAWAIYIFILVHVFVTPKIGGDAFFLLFVLAFLSFVYQYRFRSVKEVTYRSFFLNSFKNLILLAIAAHFTGGVHSPLNWFFVITLLSGVIAKNKNHLTSKFLFITGYFVFEAAIHVSIGHLSIQDVAEIILLQYFIVVLTGLYIQRISALQRKIDKGLSGINEDLSLSLEREREAKSIISSQAVELKRAQEQTALIVSAVTDGIIAVSYSGKIVFMNETAFSVTGLTGIDVESKSIAEILPFRNDDPGTQNIMEVVQEIVAGKELTSIVRYGTGEEGDNREFILLPDNTYIEPRPGEKTYIEGAIVDLGEGTGNVRFVITFHNISYRRELDQLKTDFMSVAAHQLRTPLSSIRWYLELLNDASEGKLKKNQKMFTENAYSSIIRMIELVNGLLAVTRIESSRVPSKPELIKIPVLTKEILKDFDNEVKEKDLSVHLKIDEDLPSIKLDPQLSREVFMNLISNAVRYSNKKGEILISITNEENEIHWRVSDNGIGIPKKQQSRIFEKFFRASNASSLEVKGTGLGLYLAKFIATGWGGKIWFESEEGKGATFHVTVPHEGMKMSSGEISLHA